MTPEDRVLSPFWRNFIKAYLAVVIVGGPALAVLASYRGHLGLGVMFAYGSPMAMWMACEGRGELR